MAMNSMLRFDGWLSKQGISYQVHKDSMIILSNMDKAMMASCPCWNIGVKDLLDIAIRDFARYKNEKFQNAIDYYKAVLDGRAPKVKIICFEDTEAVQKLIIPKFKQLSIWEVA